MKVESLAIEKLVLDPSNARKHSAKNLEAIKGSLAKFGQQKPIVVGKGNVVIAGNGTLEGARALGWTHIDSVRTALEGPEAIAYAIADNRTGELAEWDAGVLSETLKSLDAIDFDLSSIGFDADDLAAMIATPAPPEGLTDPDAVPENVETRCKPGDLWVLGEHRMLCGDSTNVLHIDRMMGIEKADLVSTDPPYGMSLETDRRGMGSTTTKYDAVIGDADPFDPQSILGAFPNTPKILWGADYYCHRIPSWDEGSPIVWAKAHSDDENKVFGSAFETAWVWPKKKRLLWFVRRIHMTDEHIAAHPTQKPTEITTRAIELFDVRPNGVVVDLFLGSGSTLIACEKTGRRCFGMEIDPKYCDVVLTRWEAFTGRQATLGTEA